MGALLTFPCPTSDHGRNRPVRNQVTATPKRTFVRPGEWPYRTRDVAVK